MDIQWRKICSGNLKKELETYKQIEQHFEAGGELDTRCSIQFKSQKGWKSNLPQERKWDRFNRPCQAESGERAGEYKDSQLKINRRHIDTWDSTKSPEEQKRSMTDNYNRKRNAYTATKLSSKKK